MTIAEGVYDAKPTCCGLIISKNGHDQFAIECLITPLEGDGPPVHLTKFCMFETDESLKYTLQDAENCGCDVTKDIREWEVDPTRHVRAKVIIDGKWGPKLKSIFPIDGTGGVSGALINKQAMDEGRKITVAKSVAERIAALRGTKAMPVDDFGDAPMPDDDNLPF